MPARSDPPLHGRTGRRERLRASRDRRDALTVGLMGGAALGLLFQALVSLVYMAGRLLAGPGAFETQRVNPAATLPLLVLYPVAGMIAALLQPHAWSFSARLAVALLWTLPMGVGFSLMDGGVDRYGNNSWPTSLAVAALFGLFFAVRWSPRASH